MEYVGDNLTAKRGGWSFSDIEHSKFEEHIEKSVPGYKEGHRYITFLSDYFLSSGSNFYDLGCSTGNLIAKISMYNKEKSNISFVGIEPVKKFKAEFESSTKDLKKSTNHSFKFIDKSVQSLSLEECDMVCSYYTLQFIAPKYRQQIIDQVYSKLHWGGGFFFFEKVRGIDARFHEMINLAYFEYKKTQGYTSNEIISKMFSLKGVLEPFSSRENFNFLERAGFKDITVIYKNLCFEGLLAIK